VHGEFGPKFTDTQATDLVPVSARGPAMVHSVVAVDRIVAAAERKLPGDMPLASKCPFSQASPLRASAAARSGASSGFCAGSPGSKGSCMPRNDRLKEHAPRALL